LNSVFNSGFVNFKKILISAAHQSAGSLIGDIISFSRPLS